MTAPPIDVAADGGSAPAGIVRGVPLAQRTTLGVGGPARTFFEAHDLEGLRSALAWAERVGEPVELLGGGSNLVIADEGYPGLVVAIALRGLTFDSDGDGVRVTAAAGEPWDALVARTLAEGLTGLECLSGIPGSVGATPVQNVGAYGHEVAELITRVRVLDRRDGSIRELGPRDCGFGYRDSWLKREGRGRAVVLDVTYRLVRGAAPSVLYAELRRRLDARGLPHPSAADVREVVLEVRREKSMLVDPSDPNARSCGSFFVNPVVTRAEATQLAARLPASASPMPQYPQADGRVKLAAAWLIEAAGFARGTREGSVGLSEHHALAIVAHPGARAADVVRFARRVRDVVAERFGVRLEPEPIHWGFARLDGGLPEAAATEVRSPGDGTRSTPS
jgi:UDP-N-acetylmuramate dehydrogenase